MSGKRVGAAALIVVAVASCSDATTPSTGGTPQDFTSVETPATHTPTQPEPAQPQLASDPARIADELMADERTVRDPASPHGAQLAAARRQQKAYRVLARHPEWDASARPRVPRGLLDVYDRNIDARRQLGEMNRGKATLPAWRIQPPLPAGELLGYYRKAAAESGVEWNYLAAINFVETAFGRIAGVSTAGAQGPMQFMPSTFAAYGAGSDIHSAHDSIMAAGRFLAAHGFSVDRDAAIFRYNNSDQYVRAINQYATVIAGHPDNFAGYYLWDVYYKSTAGDVVLPVGYAATAPIPVAAYLATHPQ